MYNDLCHLVAIIGHIGSAYILNRLLALFTKNNDAVTFGTIYFCISPAVAASVWSIDSAVQTMSTLFGLAAIWSLVTVAPFKREIIASGCILVSVLWKESGISWFLAAPLLTIAINRKRIGEKTRSIKKTEIQWIIGGIVGIVLYLTIRSILSINNGNIGLTEGRYSLHVSPLIWIKNAVMLLGVTITTIDTVSLFGDKSIVIAALTFMGGAPLLYITGKNISIRKNYNFLCALVTITVMGPHLFMGHVSEMYAHPILCSIILCIFVCLELPPYISLKYKIILGVGLMTCIVVSTHKYIEMYETGKRANTVAENILNTYKKTDRIPDWVCTIYENKTEKKSYSVFRADYQKASAWGRSIWVSTNWKRPLHFEEALKIEECSNRANAFWRVKRDGKFEKIVP